MQVTKKVLELNNDRSYYQERSKRAKHGYLERTLMTLEALKRRREEELDLKLVVEDLESSLRGWKWRKSYQKRK